MNPSLAPALSFGLPSTLPLIPAHAGIQLLSGYPWPCEGWIPVCAGMSGWGFPLLLDHTPRSVSAAGIVTVARGQAA
jgi:hypothetical protein